jgi:hypothetical protein
MRKKKEKSIRKTKKKIARPAKRTRSKASSPKKKPVRSQSQTTDVPSAQMAEAEVIGNIQQDSVDEAEAAVRDLLARRGFSTGLWRL